MHKLPKSTRIQEPSRVKRTSNKTNNNNDDTQERSNNVVRDFIKQCVQEELQTVSKNKKINTYNSFINRNTKEIN